MNMYAIHLSNIKYGHASTPLTYQKENPRPPSRKLWQKENVGPNDYIASSFEYTAPSMESWDKIESPQYVNFSNGISESSMADKFFDGTRNETLFKPQSPRVHKLPGQEGDTSLLSELLTYSLSKVKIEDNNSVPADKPSTNKEMKACTFSKHVKIKEEKKNDKNKFLRLTSTPFNFNGGDKKAQEQKQNRVKKQGVQEEVKQPIFRAKPVPKFVKTTATSSATSTVGRLTAVKTEEKKPHDIPAKKTEIWKKEPFRPCRSTKTLVKARTPKLSTASRALQRKRFEDRMKEREKQLELTRQQEESAKKKQEAAEVARLRKLSVHKAQPIRTYRYGLPEVQKRPLTDPISPQLSFKRRKCI